MAMKFMFRGPNMPVLFEIEIYPYEFGYAECFSLDNHKLSLYYDNEEEILL
jgi:hypothetical protein